MKEKKSSFRSKMEKSITNEKNKSIGYGYLKIPSGVQMFKEAKIKDLEITVDFVQYQVSLPNHPDQIEVGEYWWKRPFKVHRNVGADKKNVICPKSIGKRCPICDYQKKQFDAGAPIEETKLLYPSDRALYVIIPHGSGFDEVVYVWDSSDFLFGNFMKKKIEANPDNWEFAELDENGKSVEITFKEKPIGKNKMYEAGSIKFVSRDYEIDESILDTVPALDDMLAVLSYKEIEHMFFEIDDEDLATEDDVIQEPEEVEEVKPASPFVRKRPTQEPVKEEPKPEPKTEKKIPSYGLTPENTKIAGGTRSNPTGALAKPKEEPTIKRRLLSTPPAQTTGNKCPYGHQFGIDTDNKDECQNCKVWDECIDEKEAK